jgi:hypothetical protein
VPGGRSLGGRRRTAAPHCQEHFAFGYSVRDTQPEAFQGFHSQRILFIVDEASGVSELIYEAIEGSLTGDHSRLLRDTMETAGRIHRLAIDTTAQRS